MTRRTSRQTPTSQDQNDGQHDLTSNSYDLSAELDGNLQEPLLSVFSETSELPSIRPDTGELPSQSQQSQATNYANASLVAPAVNVQAFSAGWKTSFEGSCSYWRSDAVHALTQTFTLQMLKEKQAVVHFLTLGWTVSQYLCHSSNPFASSSEYLLKEDVTSEERCWPPCCGNVTEASHRTLNGMARLLDSFGDMYCNPLSKRARCEALKALEAVTSAWSTQWLYCTNDSNADESNHWLRSDSLVRSSQHKTFYADSWKYAHNQLMETKCTPSFTRSLAVFLFNMAETPECIVPSLEPGDTPIDLQDHALVQIKTLLQLVAAFTKILPQESNHRKLLESAACVMHWYAYVRDTSVAIMNERRCILDSIYQTRTLRTKEGLTGGPSPLNVSLGGLSQAAAARNIQLKRSVMRVREMMMQPDGTTPGYVDAVREVCEDIQAFNGGEGALLEQQLSSNNDLSPQMEGCIAHLLLYYNYGVLMLLQYTRSQASPTEIQEPATIELQMAAFEQQALSSVSKLAARFGEADLEHHGGSADASLYLSLVARNSNIPLVTTILAKFIAHCVESRAIENNGSSSYSHHIRVLLQSLLSLSRTMGGSSGPRAALRSLMAQYPDDLMAIWIAEVAG